MKNIAPEGLEHVAEATVDEGEEELFEIDGKVLRQGRERWWTWHWDVFEAKGVEIPYTRIKRWRRGFFFTIYRKESIGDVTWWIYLPLNIGFEFSHPTRERDEAR